MKRKFGLLWSVVAILGMTLTPALTLEIDDRCDPTRIPQSNHGGGGAGEYDYNRCDSQKGLFCNEYSRCACFVADSYYDYYYRRCLAKIGYPCKASYTFSVPCGENAECPYDTGFCQCRAGYFPTYDRRACTNGSFNPRDNTKIPFAISFALGAVLLSL